MVNDSEQSVSSPVPSMASSKLSSMDDIALREKELALRERELQIKEQEVKEKAAVENRNLWFSSPLLVGVASAVFGLLGTAVGAGLQGYFNFQLERQKFESALIQNALETDDTSQAIKRLQFLVDSGVIRSLDAAKIQQLTENPDQIPSFTRGGATR